MSRRRRIPNNEAGETLISASLVLVVLLTAGLGIYAYAMRLRAHLYATNLSEVLGKAVYRDCSALTGGPLLGCVVQLQNVAVTEAAQWGAPVDIIISEYLQPNGLYGIPAGPASVAFQSGSLNGTHTSRYSLGTVTSGPIGAMLAAHGALWIVEVFLTHRSSTTNIANGEVYVESLI